MISTGSIERRAVLGAITAAIATSVAGCLGGAPTAENEDTDTNDQELDTDDEETDPADEPAAFPDDRKCAVCNMVAAEHPDWNAQLSHENGDRVVFCSSGCMAAYLADPPRFDGPDAAVTRVWVTAFDSGELIDASEAQFVRVTDPDHVDDIMMRNPTPFADRSEAEAFIEEFDAYDDGDLITLEEFDRELGEFYRGDFFDGTDDNQ